ncbi:MAG: hypothetical protein AAGL49_04990 [Pseudomonadota bacterium]
MSAHIESLDKMFAIWNTSDEARKGALVDQALEHNVHFADPRHNIIGRDPFLRMVADTQKQIPGAVYARSSDVGFQNNFCRYHWTIQTDGKLLMTGFDFVEVNDSGKISKVIGFFGELEREDPLGAA